MLWLTPIGIWVPTSQEDDIPPLMCDPAITLQDENGEFLLDENGECLWDENGA